MIRFKVVDKNLSFLSTNDKRFEITLYSMEDKKTIFKHETGKLNGKFSHHIEKSKLLK
jgi:hypothetical protein